MMDIQALLQKLMSGGASPGGMPWSDQQNQPPPMPGPTSPPSPSGAATGAVDPMGAFGNAPGMPPGATPPTPTTTAPTPMPALGADNGANPSMVRRLMAMLLGGGSPPAAPG